VSSITTDGTRFARSIVTCTAGATDLALTAFTIAASAQSGGESAVGAVAESISALDAASLSTYRSFVSAAFCPSEHTASRATGMSLVVHATGDLYQRLLAYSSARALAYATGRVLLLLWRPDAQCEASFDALFAARPGELVLGQWSDSLFPDSLFAGYRELAPRRAAHVKRADGAGIAQHCMGETHTDTRRYVHTPRSLLSSPDVGTTSDAVVGQIDEQHDHIFVRASSALVTSTVDYSVPTQRGRLAAALRTLEPARPVRAALTAMLDGADNDERDLIGLLVDIDDAADCVGRRDALECRRGGVETTAHAMRAACTALVRSKSAALRTPPSCSFLLFNGDSHDAKTHALGALLSTASAMRGAASSARAVAPELALIELRSQLAVCRDRPSAALECVRAQAARLFAMGRNAELVVLPACTSALSEVVLALHHGRQDAAEHPSDSCGWLATRFMHAGRTALPARASAARPSSGPAAVSIVVACRGRHGPLEVNLPSWLNVRGVGELVVVDWSSTPPLRDAVERALVKAAPERQRLRPPLRVLLARVEDEATWVLSRAYNVGFRLATGALVLKLDCDVLVRPEFVKAHAPALLRATVEDLQRALLAQARADEPASLRRQAFVAGDWRRARSADELSLNGLLLAWRTALHTIGGYDERIATYGWDDSELYSRLERSGERRMPLARDATTNLTLAQHARHTSEERLVHSDVGAPGSADDDETAERSGRVSLARVVGAVSAAELELTAGERAVLAIQQNRIALEALPNAWGQPCDAAMAPSVGNVGDGFLATSSDARPLPAAAGACLPGARARFDGWCGSRYEWLRVECAASSAERVAVDLAGDVSLVVLRSTSPTPPLRAILGEATFLAAWYEALAQELRGFRATRAKAAIDSRS
jgi:hypothetical protein